MPKRRFPHFCLFFCLIAGSASAACAFRPPAGPAASWAYADLRGLDGLDSPQAASDLIAAYVRFSGSEVQFRFDLLKMEPTPDFDLILALDRHPGVLSGSQPALAPGMPWDLVVVISAGGDIQVHGSLAEKGTALQLAGPIQPPPALKAVVMRDPGLDYLTVRLDRAGLGYPPPGFRFKAFLTQPGSLEIADRLGPLSTAEAPPAAAPVILAFTGALTAYTPAQALRHWDGAHTGPLGGRHGLYNLLRTARAAKVPLFLLDLNTPTSLSALDYLGHLGLVAGPASGGLVNLPYSIPPEASAAWPSAALARINAEDRQVAAGFGLPSSPFLFLPGGSSPATAELEQEYAMLLIPGGATPTPTAVARSGALKILALNGLEPGPEAVPQIDLEGPTLNLRRALASAALLNSLDTSRVGRQVLVLGGSLPASPWGNPQAARAALRYLNAHPWIQVLSGPELLSIQPGQAAMLEAGQPPGVGAEAQLFLPDTQNPLSLAAWQAWRALALPVFPAPVGLDALRETYLPDRTSSTQPRNGRRTPSPGQAARRPPNGKDPRNASSLLRIPSPYLSQAGPG